MTDLDRKIAELKGYEIEMHENGDISIFDSENACVFDAYIEGLQASWSTSDAKAFELVDEVATHGPNMAGRWYFRIAEEYVSPGLDYMPWDAMFLYCVGPGIKHKVREHGNTRAEAICRAYIALKEWEGKE